MAKILRELKSPSLAIDGASDHVHILFSLGRVITIADVVEEVKTNTSKWIKTRGRVQKLSLQRGYGAFSIVAIQRRRVEALHSRSKEHHRRVTFQEEYRKFLKAYGIEYDERYVWD
jgi:hypothetical protein